MPGKSEIKCHTRWLELNDVSHCVTGTWTLPEDKILIELVLEHGPRNWTKISKSLPGRIGKQCRERWHNHLDPNISKKKWTLEEDIKIVKLHLIHGNRWCDIAKEVTGRTDNAIKNRFNSNLTKRLHEEPFSSILDGTLVDSKVPTVTLPEKTEDKRPQQVLTVESVEESLAEETEPTLQKRREQKQNKKRGFAVCGAWSRSDATEPTQSEHLTAERPL